MKSITDFEKLVYKACKKISKGRVSTYLQIARAIKNPKSARAVGNALNKNPFAPKVPCHRVVKSNACVGGFESGSENKICILKKEGVEVKNNKIVDFRKIIVLKESIGENSVST